MRVGALVAQFEIITLSQRACERERHLATFRRKNRGQNRETTRAAGGIPCKNEDFVAQRPDLDGTDAKLLMMRSNYQEFIVD